MTVINNFMLWKAWFYVHEGNLTQKRRLTFVFWIRRTKNESNRLTPTPHIKLVNQMFYAMIVIALSLKRRRTDILYVGESTLEVGEQTIGETTRRRDGRNPGRKDVCCRLPCTWMASVKACSAVVVGGSRIHMCWLGTKADGVSPPPSTDRCSWSARANSRVWVVLMSRPWKDLACRCFCRAGLVVVYATIARTAGSSELHSLRIRLDLKSGMVWASLADYWVTRSSICFESPGHQTDVRALDRHLVIPKWPVWMQSRICSFIPLWITKRSSYMSKSSTAEKWLLLSQYGRRSGWWGM